MTTPVFEEDESAIEARMMGRVPEEWDKEDGSYIHDAVAPVPLEVKTLQQNQDFIVDSIAFALTAKGKYLDKHVAEVGLTRNPATQSKRVLTINANTGAVIPKGHTVSTVVETNTPVQFTTDAEVTAYPATVVVTCKTFGTVGNIPTGASWVLIPGIVGVISIQNLGDADDVDAVNEETDANLLTRYLQKVQNPGGSGSKYDYVNWAYQVSGVGAARCLPLWNGPGTVKVVIANSDLQPADEILVAAGQAHIDPNQNGDGSGVAPIGATTTVISFTGVAINVTATIDVGAGYTLAGIKAAFETVLAAYLAATAFAEDNTVKYSKIGTTLGNVAGVDDYSNLLVNAGTANIAMASNEIPVKGTVTLS